MGVVKRPYILWFKDIHKKDISLVGGKGANLGELTNAGLPVPNGFCITVEAYYLFLEKTGLKKEIAAILDDLDFENNKELNKASVSIKRLILRSTLPQHLVTAIEKAYYHLGGFPSAVRSSATAEDLPGASFAGQQASFLNVLGLDDIKRAIVKCYASLFEARAIYYRAINNYDHMKVGISAVVQNMIQSDTSGILFTVDPTSEDKNVMVIEAGFGLGEAIVSGSVTPDRYLINKETLEIIGKEISIQKWKIVHNVKGGDKHVGISAKTAKQQKLTDDQILRLAKIGLEIEKHYNLPQDTEWAIEENKIYFVQSRPITTLNKNHEKTKSAQDSKETNIDSASVTILLRGAAASLGLASGSVKIIHKPTEIDKIDPGDVLVTEMTTPDFVPAMRKAKAIITDTGGRTCHAAIVSRELGIPCVVGTGMATHKLKNSQMVTVDGAKGLVYQGRIEQTEPTPATNPATGAFSGSALVEEIPITGTKVYVNLGEPDLASEVAKLPVDGVGLLRAEFMVAALGEHPKAMVADGRGDAYVNALVAGLNKIAGAFDPRPVVYRATDFKTNEYRGLKGGEKFEPVEDNPMIGYRGASRYIADPEMFALELKAIKRVREEYDLKNLWIMIPFVRTTTEMAKCMEMIKAAGLIQGSDLKIWMMCEVPSNVILLDKFIDLGIDGISIGSNDLTQLTLGVDRDNQTLAKLFDERDEAIQMSIEYVIKTCRKRSITCSICGQAPSVYPEITEMMVRAGTTSVSVTPDVAVSTKKLIASVEKRLLLQNIIRR